jgi:hypothetical protein
MSAIDADMLIVRDPDDSRIPDSAGKPIFGVSRFDVEHALVNPRVVFGSPGDVARQPDISVRLRERILQAWEYDIRAEMIEENEGGPVRDTNADSLAEIRAAKTLLESKRKAPGSADTGLNARNA